LAEWLEGLPATQRKNAERLLGLIRGIELEDEEERKQLYLSGMLAFERLRLRCFGTVANGTAQCRRPTGSCGLPGSSGTGIETSA
jgi:hypothetical protein